jgi:hypothetical protein
MHRTRFVLTLFVVGLSAPAFAQPTETLRGRVTNDSGRVVVGATVVVTRGPDRATKQGATDSTGRYEVLFENGTGDYLIAVSAPRLRTARRRVQRTGSERVLTADFVLSVDLAMLAAVNVKAALPERVQTRVSPYALETGSAEKWAEGVNAQLSPMMAGNLSAIASTMPGITMGAGGISVLGSGAASNLTTLNGMALAGGAVPRAARVQTRVSATSYDALRGGFSGAATDVRLGPGDRGFQNRATFFSFETPQLQQTDAIGRALGAPLQTLRASGGVDGEAITGVLTYNLAADFSRVTSTPATLLGGDPLAFSASGVSTDSVQRLRDAAQRLSIPLSTGSAPRVRQRDAFSLIGRFDLTTDSTWDRHLTTLISRSSDGALGFGPLAAPSSGGEQRETAATAALSLGHFFGPRLSRHNLFRLNASIVRNRTSGYLDAPTAAVVLRSVGPNADGLTTVELGGTSQAVGQIDRWTIEGTDELTRNFRGRRHTVRAAVWGRADGETQTGGSNLLGRVAYNSIDDLVARRPASFTRTLSLADRTGAAWNSALAMTHSWAPSRFLSILYGVRAEAGGFATQADDNTSLQSALGVRSDVRPLRVHVSPRFGFSYSFNKSRNNGSGTAMNQSGVYYRYATGVLRGGFGEFRDLFQPGVVADVAARTGLPGSALSLTCVGAAIPTFNWADLIASPTASPTQCADGSGALAERAPGVAVLDRQFDVPRSWRASLDYNTARAHLMLRVSALGTLDLAQTGTVDANFGGVERFRLTAEGDRPVFVSPSAIDVATGAVSPVESRRSAQFSRVSVRRSDLRGAGGQITGSLSMDPFDRFWGKWPRLSVAYTLQQSRRQARGFDGATLDDPRRVEWAPSHADARHIAVVQSAISRPWMGTITAFVRAQSGLPFTPVVQGDINGDGRGSDRAFVPSLGTTADGGLDTGLRALLASGSQTAQRCLRANLGRVVERNGCRGPWTQTLNVQWQPPLPTKWRSRTVASLFINNLLGGVDQLVHGAGGLRGWGGQQFVDGTLLIPRGFDAAARRFRYDVNPRFAETRPSRMTMRDPFRITLDVNLKLHTNYDMQSLRRAIEPVRVGDRWTRRTEDSLTALYLRRTSSIHRLLVDESDSLFLSTDQLAQLRVKDSVFADGVRAIYRPLAQYLASFEGTRPTQAALDSVSRATKAYWKLFWQQPEIADSVLTPVQRDLVGLVKDMLANTPAMRLTNQYFFGASVPLVHTPAVPPKNP